VGERSPKDNKSEIQESRREMKVAVTGGAGFIGSWILEELERRGHKAIVLDHRGRVAEGMLGDVRDDTAVMELAAHVDGIIHLAAILGTVETIDAPLPAAHTNIIGTLNVFEAASRYDLPVVFAAVGNANIARGTYCITKSASERFVNMYREDRGLKVISVRPMNAYGPRQSAPIPYSSSKVRKIVPSFVCSALSGDPIRIYGDGTQISDSVWVGDVARVFVTALEEAAKGNVPKHPIDVGNEIPTSVLEVANEVIKNVPGATLNTVPMRAGEPFGGPLNTQEKLLAIVDAVMATNEELDRKDVRRVLRELGTVVSADTTTLEAIGIDYKSFKPLSEGIAETVAWFRANEGITWNYPSK
jgi:nucleoside-diphosphate-sugar epimerase